MSSSIEGEEPLFFKFKPASHRDTVLKRIATMRFKEILTDVVLVVDDKEFPAHRNILAASSEYFRGMFAGPIGHDSKRENLQGVSSTAVERLLDFIYNGEIEITEDSVQDILVASRVFLLDAVTKACCKFTQDRISVDNCWGIRNMADKYSCRGLLGKVNMFIQDNFAEAKTSAEFVKLPFELVKELMADDELNVREDELVSAVLMWVDHDRNTRHQHLEALFKLLRLGYISKDYMTHLCEENDLVSRKAYLVDLIKTVHDEQLLSDEPCFSEKLMTLITQEEFAKICKPRKWQQVVPVLTAVGGTQTLFYNTEEKVWVSLAAITTRHCPGLAGTDGKMYLVGGSRNWIRLSECEMYSPMTDTWQDMAHMKVARSNMGLVVLERYIYAVGGYDGDSPTRYVERYDTDKNQWMSVSAMNELRDGACVVSDGSNLFAITGFDGNDYLDTMEVYDPSEDAWRLQGYSRIKEKRQDAMSAYLDGKVYVIGGYRNQVCMASGEAYDIEENKWSPIAAMSCERNKAGCAAINKKIFICGGWEGSGMVLASVEFYDTETDCWLRLSSLPTPSAMRATFVHFPRKQVDKLTVKSKGRKQKHIHAISTSASV